MLLSHRSVKNSLSATLPFEMLEILDLIIILFTFSSFYLKYTLSGYLSVTSLSLFGVAILYQILPIQYIAKKVFHHHEAKNEV